MTLRWKKGLRESNDIVISPDGGRMDLAVRGWRTSIGYAKSGRLVGDGTEDDVAEKRSQREK